MGLNAQKLKNLQDIRLLKGHQTQSALILGAGPAGLTAAYELQKSGLVQACTLEGQDQVGGLSKTVSYKGYHFDIGGHRFFTRSEEVLNLWNEILPHDFIKVPRSSQIYYSEKFLNYPLNAIQCLKELPPSKIMHFVASYLKQSLKKRIHPKNYEEWMIQNFGESLYLEFFKSYTEKVWGISCREISADWAAQRINKLNIAEVIRNSIGARTSSKSLIEEFLYPRKGPGQLWNECAKKIEALGGRIELNQKVRSITLDHNEWVIETDRDKKYKSHALFYSLPLGLLPKLSPGLLPPRVEIGLSSLRYRHFVTVALMGKEVRQIPTQWFYIQDHKLKLGRIQNYKYWSPEMVPSADKVCLGLEFFCSEGDGHWELDDKSWIEVACRELESLQLFPDLNWIEESAVVKVERAYPIYNDNYEEKVSLARKALEKVPNFYPIGRNGMHRYNNQDHAMMTALISTQQYLGSKSPRNPWNVNQDAIYIEA